MKIRSQKYHSQTNYNYLTDNFSKNLSSPYLNNFRAKMFRWYSENQRDLPWRHTKDAYKIWLSEIIMQQTRIEQGLAYYEKFTQQFPRVIDLAEAQEETILRLWQGLGYYSRARNLHKAAKLIMEVHGGTFPNTYEAILKLPGVGPYTAAAISSFAFDIPKAVVDGNVYRFLSRLFNIETPIDSSPGQKQFQHIADQLISEKNPADHNQGMMEQGATVCTYKNPQCDICAFNDLCISYSKDTISERPVKKGKIKTINRHLIYVVWTNSEEKIGLKQREEKGIWAKLYEPDLIFDSLEDNDLVAEEETRPFLKELNKITTIKHLLSHQKLTIEIYAGKINQHPNKVNKSLEWYAESDIKNLALPKPFIEILQ